MSDDDLEQRAKARIGRVLGDKYVLETLLGIGGMAAVYEARHRNGHRVAVKMLHADVARDEDVRARFLREGYAANKVDHPGAVQVIDDDAVKVGEDAGSAYLVMELLEGESVLSRARKQGTLSEGEVLAIAEGVLDVLVAAHGRGIVHRDLKPDNLFLVPRAGGSELVKVLDFGIARIADSVARTKIGTTLGTPSYMAPEQARGGRDVVDGRADLFALGATMFRLLSARRIHEGGSATEILAKMATLPAAPIRTVKEGISAPMAAIIDRALRFDRELRYADAATMRDDVRAARAGERLPSGSVPGDDVPSAVGFSAGSDITGLGPAAPVQERTVATMAAPAAPRYVEPATLVPASAPASAPAVPGAVPRDVTPPLPETIVRVPPELAPTVAQAMPPVSAAPEKKRVPLALLAVFGVFTLTVVGLALVFVINRDAETPRVRQPVEDKPVAHDEPHPDEPHPAAEEPTSEEPAPAAKVEKPAPKPASGAKPAATATTTAAPWPKVTPLEVITPKTAPPPPPPTAAAPPGKTKKKSK